MSFSQLNGVFVLNKPSGCTSHACLQRIKKELHQKKIGHAGTLDPMVEGVLLVLLGYGTKISQYLTEAGKKVYRGVLCFGYETDTWDREGHILCTTPYEHITTQQVHDAMLSWKNLTEQDVPPVSAAKFKGKPLYKWKRMGHTVPRKVKSIAIDAVEVIDIDMPYVSFRVSCSSGTYIRSLAHSLGKSLSSSAVLEALVREESYPFSLADATPLGLLMEKPELLQQNLKTLAMALPMWECVEISQEDVAAVRHGKSIVARDLGRGVTNGILSFQGREIALAVLDSQKHLWKILRGL